MTDPTPLFDTLENLPSQNPPTTYSHLPYATDDFNAVKKFLLKCTANKSTFELYRKDLERLLYWSWLIVKKSILHLQSDDIRHYIDFINDLPGSWVGDKRVPRFIKHNNNKTTNPKWRLFFISPQRKLKNSNLLAISRGTQQQSLHCYHKFYDDLNNADHVKKNPLVDIVGDIKHRDIHNKKAIGVKIQQEIQVNKLQLSDPIGKLVLETLQNLQNSSNKHERALFIITIAYSLQLQFKDILDINGLIPKMNHFICDEQQWWFTIPDNHEIRRIPVNITVLNALKRWRSFLGLPDLPSPNETTALLPKATRHNQNPLTCVNHLRYQILRPYFKIIIDKLNKLGLIEEALKLDEVSTAWLNGK